jgi:hypothetical protein
VSATEILAELPKLSREELCSIALQVDQTLRQQGAIIYDDAYGVFTEADQTALVIQAWDLMDGDHGTAPAR